MNLLPWLCRAAHVSRKICLSSDSLSGDKLGLTIIINLRERFNLDHLSIQIKIDQVTIVVFGKKKIENNRTTERTSSLWKQRKEIKS